MTPINQPLTIYRGITFTFFFVLRDAQAFVDAITASTSTNAIATGSAHGLVVGDPVRFASVDTGVLPSPLATNTTYFVAEVVDTTHFKVSETYGGVEVDIIAVGTGTSNCYTYPPIDLTGWSVWAQIRTVAGAALTVDLDPQIDGDPTTGRVDLSKTDEQTALYALGNFVWDLIFENAGGERLGPLFSGNVRILETVAQGA